jgi:hypothetical protein
VGAVSNIIENSEPREFIISNGWLIVPKSLFFVKTKDVQLSYLKQKSWMLTDKFSAYISTDFGFNFEIEFEIEGDKDKAKATAEKHMAEINKACNTPGKDMYKALDILRKT